MCWGQEIVRNLCTFQGSPDRRESVRELSKNNLPINRVISRQLLGGQLEGRTRCSYKSSKVTRAPLGQHTCFLSCESTGFPVFSSWKRDLEPIFMFRLKLMQGQLSNANLAARSSSRMSSDRGVCFHEGVTGGLNGGIREGRAMGGSQDISHLAELPCSFSGPAQGRVWAWTERIPPALSLVPGPETHVPTPRLSQSGEESRSMSNARREGLYWLKRNGQDPDGRISEGESMEGKKERPS